jgi:hypothetical protein
MNRSYNLVMCFCIALISSALQAQVSPVRIAVDRARESGVSFRKVIPFAKSSFIDPVAQQGAKRSQILDINKTVLEQIVQERPDAISLELPYLNEVLRIDLVRVQVVTPGFSVITDLSDTAPVPYEAGVHYQGYLPGSAQSIAAFSFFRDDVMAVFSDKQHGNMNTGKLKNTGQGDHFMRARRWIH